MLYDIEKQKEKKWNLIIFIQDLFQAKKNWHW